METAQRYRALAEHYRQAKRATKNKLARHQLETLERSYRVLAASAVVLERSVKVPKEMQRK
jgi:hypothetical protein